MLTPVHLRLLLAARPALVDKVLRLEEAPPIERLLKRAARQAKLPLKEDSDANSVQQQQQQQQQPTQQRSASAAPARAGGASSKGKGSAERSRSVGGHRTAPPTQRSEGRGGGVAATVKMGGKGKGAGKGVGQEEDKDTLPTLFQEDWDAKLVDELLPGMAEGLLIAPTMSSAKLLAQRMKGATGKLAMICLDQIDDSNLRQKQVQVSLGVKHGAGRRAQASTAWLVQRGQEDVKLLSAVQTVDIQPKTGQTQVTGVHFEKTEITAELRKDLEAKSGEVAKTYFGTVVDEGARHMLDVFPHQRRGERLLCALKVPQSSQDSATTTVWSRWGTHQNAKGGDCRVWRVVASS